MTTTTAVTRSGDNNRPSDDCVAHGCNGSKEKESYQMKQTTKKPKLMNDDDDDESPVAVENVDCSSSHDENNINDSDAIVFLTSCDDFIDCIFEENVQLAVWRRSKLPGFVKPLAALSVLNNLPTFNGTVTPSTVAQLMKGKLMIKEQQLSTKSSSNNSQRLSDAHIMELITDVERLVRAFASIIANDDEDNDEQEREDDLSEVAVHVRLECLEDNGCAFWHQDTVPLRLVTTYLGPCTEYVHPSYSQETLDTRQVDSSNAQSLTLYDVALFKGRCFDQAEEEADDADDDPDVVVAGSGIVHRSPRIEDTGVVRLILVLDIPADFHDNDTDEEGEAVEP